MAAEALWEAAGRLLGATAALLEVALVLLVVAHVVLPLLRAYFAPRAAGLTVYAGAAALVDAIAARCPALFDPKRRGFQPTWWLFNGHLQTGYTALLGEDDSFAVTYERELLETPDGGVNALDWAVHPAGGEYAPDTPTVVILHGLTGGSQEGYVKSLIHYLQHDSTETVRCVVFNARGCAQSELRTAQLYSAAYTDDFRNALRYIQRRLPGAPLVAVGYSLGSNILVKYLGEEGERTPLVGAASVGNPFDLLYCMRRLQHRWFYRLVYANKLGFNLKRAFCRHRHVFDAAGLDSIDIEHLLQSQSVLDFDERLTRRIFGYRTVDEYYRDGSCARYVAHVAVPLLCLSARDDPICSNEAIPYDECRLNPLVTLAVTQFGGHLGFFTGHPRPKHWDSEAVGQYFEALFALHKRGALEPTVEKLRAGVVPFSTGPHVFPVTKRILAATLAAEAGSAAATGSAATAAAAVVVDAEPGPPGETEVAAVAVTAAAESAVAAPVTAAADTGSAVIAAVAATPFKAPAAPHAPSSGARSPPTGTPETGSSAEEAKRPSPTVAPPAVAAAEKREGPTPIAPVGDTEASPSPVWTAVRYAAALAAGAAAVVAVRRRRRWVR